MSVMSYYSYLLLRFLQHIHTVKITAPSLKKEVLLVHTMLTAMIDWSGWTCTTKIKVGFALKCPMSLSFKL